MGIKLLSGKVERRNILGDQAPNGLGTDFLTLADVGSVALAPGDGEGIVLAPEDEEVVALGEEGPCKDA